MEMTGLWKAWKAKGRLPTLPTAPWKSRHRQARFPHSHSSGDYAVEKWKSKNSFPTFRTAVSLVENRTNNQAGFAPRPARRRFAPAIAENFML